MIKKFSRYCLAAVVLFFVACTAERVEDTTISEGNDGKIFVSIGQSINIKSRTALDQDGRSSIWTAGDKIAVWAMDSEGNMDMTASPFTLYRFTQSLNQAVFSAFIDPLESDTYTYFATYPTPTSVSGTEAIYTIPT